MVSNDFLKSMNMLIEISPKSKTSYKHSSKFAMVIEVDLFLRNQNYFEVNNEKCT